MKVVAVVSAGGAIGATLRYAAAVLAPVDHGAFPWTTLLVNIIGCFAMGILAVLITEYWPSQKLLRPFLGTGVLGGFTTFSTFAVEVSQLSPVLAVAYFIATPVLALAAVWSASSLISRRIS